MRRLLASAVLLTLLGGCAAGTPPNPSPAGARPSREALDNGVTLIVQEHRASEVVALQLWMRIGGRDEAPNELGLTHYLEHMLFKGTPTRPPGSIDRLIERLGGQSNAFTSYDATHYDVVLPAGQLQAGLELLADIAVNASLEQSDLDAERKVVFEEMRLTQDNPDRYLLRRIYELAYAPHAYGRPILGTPELIGALTRKQLEAYYRKYYVPRQMVLVVVGAVRPDEVRRLARATFGRLDATGAPRPATPTLARLGGMRQLDVPRSEKQAYLGLGWRTAPTNDTDVYAVDLLTYILGDGPSSRLNQTVRERQRLVYSIDAGYGAWEKAGLVRAEGVTEAERQRALVTAESNYAFDIETVEGLAKSYGQAETTWTLEDELQYLSRLRQVTAEEIQAVARRYFGDDNYSRVRFVPTAR
jgi:zinc protease